ncbi:MAG: NigD-like C-terminal domain-containing protein [Bacteroidales bacterium]|nr:NigD-like C-terminal domain-containing protein [Bacteroidales bacterium]
MKFRQALLIGIFIALSACSSDFEYGLGDFRMDFATVSESSIGRYYLLDNQTNLLPPSTISSEIKTGSRVLLNYTIKGSIDIKTYSIGINSVGIINSSSIKPLTNYPDDPLRIESVWLCGDWLNFRLSFDYLEKKHSLELFQRTTPLNDTIYLELRHSKNGDAPGYWVKTYYSSSVKSFAKIGMSVPIKLRINTSNEGIKEYYFNYVNPTQN